MFSSAAIAGNEKQNKDMSDKSRMQDNALSFLNISPSFIYCVVNHHRFCHSRLAGILLIPP
jgi:hypothetical protein